MNKVLVTGGNGFLGKRLRQLLESKSFHVIGSGLGKDRLEGHNHSYVELDVTNKAQCLQVLEENKPDVIVNAAAMTNVDDCEVKKKECLQINTDSISNLNISKNRHFIQISTDFIFDGNNGPYSENVKPNPINYYGFCKYLAEQKITNTNWNYTIIRTCLVFGEDEDSNNISETNKVIANDPAGMKGQGWNGSPSDLTCLCPYGMSYQDSDNKNMNAIIGSNCIDKKPSNCNGAYTSHALYCSC